MLSEAHTFVLLEVTGAERENSPLGPLRFIYILDAKRLTHLAGWRGHHVHDLEAAEAYNDRDHIVGNAPRSAIFFRGFLDVRQSHGHHVGGM